jgi:hypothetical protein
MRSRFIALATLLSITAVASAAAQTEPRVLVGKRVRITMPDTMGTSEPPTSTRPLVVIGQLVAFNDSTMSVRNEASSGDVTVARSRVQRVEVSTGSNRRASAVTGGLIGLGLGGVLGYAAGDDCSDREFICFPQEETAVAGAFFGAALGSLIGLLVGHSERWKETAVPARVSVIPIGTRAISLTSTLRF